MLRVPLHELAHLTLIVAGAGGCAAGIRTIDRLCDNVQPATAAAPQCYLYPRDDHGLVRYWDQHARTFGPQAAVIVIKAPPTTAVLVDQQQRTAARSGIEDVW